VSLWKHSGTHETATAPDDESLERDLFARRARAMGASEGVPSLDAVLRAAGPAEDHAPRARVAHHVATGMALVAAGFAVLVMGVPRFEHRLDTARPVTAEIDAGPAASMSREDATLASWMGGEESEPCSVDPSRVYAQLHAEERACVAPPMSFEPSAASVVAMSPRAEATPACTLAGP
jgi:hypothetical protein